MARVSPVIAQKISRVGVVVGEVDRHAQGVQPLGTRQFLQFELLHVWHQVPEQSRWRRIVNAMRRW